MKHTICIAAIAALIGTPALAADIAIKAPPPAPPPPPVFSWTGCYLGGHVGGAWISKQFNGPFSATLPSAFVPFDIAVVALSGSNIDDNGSGGFLGGFQTGCNYQYASNWVVGIDGDASWGGITASTNQSVFTSVTATGPNAPAIASLANSTGTLAAKTDFIATLTGRFGYTRDRTMVYAKGGAAWTHDNYSFNGQVTNTICTTVTLLPPPPSCSVFTAPITTPFNFSATETRLGWTLGGGLEWAFWDNWSAKLEYDFLDFGTRNVTFTDGKFGSQSIGVRQRISEVKLGVNYLFNWH